MLQKWNNGTVRVTNSDALRYFCMRLRGYNFSDCALVSITTSFKKLEYYMMSFLNLWKKIYSPQITLFQWLCQKIIYLEFYFWCLWTKYFLNLCILSKNLRKLLASSKVIVYLKNIFTHIWRYCERLTSRWKCTIFVRIKYLKGILKLLAS
jgi:hypothetical protein